jgi:hypothetical protein
MFPSNSQLRADLQQRQDASKELSLKVEGCRRRKSDLHRQLLECQVSDQNPRWLYVLNSELTCD